MAKQTLKKTPRTVLYSIAGAGAFVMALAVIAEVFSPGSIEQVRGAVDVVVVEVGLIVAALATVVGPVLALLNLSDDKPEKTGSNLKPQGYEHGV